MGTQVKIPVLIELLFGEAAETAQRGASQRLRRWAKAFEAWLEQRGKDDRRDTRKQSRLAWARLLRQQGKMPWEITAQDVQAHAAWMETQGYAASTIANALGMVANFYCWCAAHKVDPACGEAFNPAAGVTRPKAGRYAGAAMWSRGELQALLEALRCDPSPLGKRDLAFFLARLELGAPLHQLQRLQWGQIEPAGEGGAWVRWEARSGDGPHPGDGPRPGKEERRCPLPAQVWEAILDWLRASGRLEGMQAGSYVFAPLADPLREQAPERREAWAEGRPIARCQILYNLKLYGRRAGIEEQKLTLMALRRTAARLKLDEAAEAVGMVGAIGEVKAFLDSREQPALTKRRLKQLPPLPAGEGKPGAQEAGRAETPKQGAPPREAPRRARHSIQPGEGLKHGFYAGSQPPEALQALLDENIRGLDQEIEGLRRMGRRLLELHETARGQDALPLGDAYTLAATRLAHLIEAERRMEKAERASAREGGTLEELQLFLEEQKGSLCLSEDPPAGEEPPELDPAARHLAEEIASARLVLRRTLALAQVTGETREVLNLAELYGKECTRLVRLLQAQGSEAERLAELDRAAFEQALTEVMEEMNIHI